jgi:hypothetical protein
MPINFQNYINANQFSDLGNLIGFDEKTGMQGVIPPALTGGRSLGEMAVRGAAMNALGGEGGVGGGFSGAIEGAVSPFKKMFDFAKTSVGEVTSKLPSFDYTSSLGKIEME